MAIMAGVLGALIGSFLNVVVYRMPRRLSLVAPPSACPGCGARIRAFDNIPVLSWFLLRGRCRSCRTTISVRYPLVELGTALFFAAVTVWWLSRAGGIVVGSAGGTAAGTATAAGILTLLAFLFLAAASIALALIDLDTQRLPNRIVLPGVLVMAVLLGAAGILSADYSALLRAGLGALILGGAYAVLAFARPGGMGFGDVKLALLLGLSLGWIGWPVLAVGAFSAFLLGGLFALVLLVLRRVNRRSGIPFGPWMLIGAWVGIFFGDAIVAGYLAIFGLA